MTITDGRRVVSDMGPGRGRARGVRGILVTENPRPIEIYALTAHAARERARRAAAKVATGPVSTSGVAL